MSSTKPFEKEILIARELWKKIPSPSAKVFACISLFLWISSLFFVGLVDDEQPILGWVILYYGWIGVQELINFAWLANILFGLSFFMLIFRFRMTIPAILTVILSLDTFRLNSVGIDSFGLGTVLWWLSFCVILYAAVVNNIENSQNNPDVNLSFENVLKVSAVSLFLLVISSAIFFYTQYYMIDDIINFS